MDNNKRRVNSVKWMGLALILAGITVQGNSRLGNAFLCLALAGFLLLA